MSGGLNQRHPVSKRRPGDDANGFMVNGADAEEGVLKWRGPSFPTWIRSLNSASSPSNFNAEYGNFGGGLINVVTKSGANQIHGDLFDFSS